MKLVALTLLLAALAGCATSSSTSSRGVVGEAQDARQIDLLFQELETEEDNLKTLLASFSSESAVDCPRACDLRASIANLARRICAVTARSADRERQVQCVDARRRSEIANTDVKSVCECKK